MYWIGNENYSEPKVVEVDLKLFVLLEIPGFSSWRFGLEFERSRLLFLDLLNSNIIK